MNIPIQELLRHAKDSIEFNESHFIVDDDGVRKTISLSRLPQASSSPPAATGLFCGTYTSEGEWFLTGGTVTGGTGNITVPDEELVLGDVDPIPVNGTQTWLEISGTALTEDGLLMPGFNVSGVTVGTGATLPTPNQIPSAADPTGLLYLSLGMWSNGKFIPAGCGNIQVFHCLGFLSTNRTLP